MAARKKAVKKQVTRNAVDRLVEDLISGTGRFHRYYECQQVNTLVILNFEFTNFEISSESMAKGDFDNLKGTGKPLPERRAGAHIITDFTRHKVNQCMLDAIDFLHHTLGNDSRELGNDSRELGNDSGNRETISGTRFVQFSPSIVISIIYQNS